MLLNMDGYWLMGGGYEKDFAFMFEEKKDSTMKNPQPRYMETYLLYLQWSCSYKESSK